VLRAHGLGDAEYGSLFVPQLGLAALGALGAGFPLARVGARRALAAGFAFMGLSQVALATVVVAAPPRVYPLSLLGAALLGLGAGLSAGPLNAYPQVLFPARSESAVVALHTVVGLGLSASPLLSGLALSMEIWTAYPLLLLGLGGLFTAAVLRENLPEPEPRSGGARPSRPVGSARLWMFLCVAFLYGSTEALFGNWSVPFLTEERALGPAEATLALASFWAALSVGRVAVALLVTKVRPAPVLPLLALLMGAGSWLVPAARGDSGAILVLSIGGLGCSAVFPLALGLACGRFPDHRAWVSGAMFAALCSGLAIGSLAAGLAHQSLDLASIYRLGAVAPALAAVLAGVAGRGDTGDAARPLPPGVPPGV
jgi:fucose permease